MILNVYDVYPQNIVDLYIQILVVGTIAYVLGMFLGYIKGGGIKTNFSYDVMDSEKYEQRVIKITKTLLICGIVGLVVSYLVMGFIPLFAEDPISAKLFRGQYQAPYARVASLYRASFYIVSTIMPIACIIWYRHRSKFFLFAIVTVLVLMAMSLARSGAFMGIVIAFAIVMSFKSRWHFAIMMVLVVGVFVLSSFFYYIVGVRTFSDDVNVWKIITAGTPDITDHLDFLGRFEENPVWTYGRTMYGGLIPGHYKWNPAVYTLTMVNPGTDINEIGSGGLRLPLPMWGYVSFGWIGVISFSFLTGIIGGAFVKMLQELFHRFDSIVIRTIGFIALGTVVGIFQSFTQMSIYFLPPAFVCLFYLYRIKLK
jgi:oligosaccharide repeat unit polymerase